MEWQSISIETVHEKTDELGYIITSLGINGVEIEDETDFREFLDENTDKWDYVDEKLLEDKKGKTVVKVYLPETCAGRDSFFALKERISALKKETDDFGSLEISVCRRDEKEWEENWKQYFKPFKVGNSMIVSPLWEEVQAGEGEKIIKIDPGMLFGTGLHATTRLCLAEIEKEDQSGRKIADIGCGSGILSAAAIKYGAQRAFLMDIDGNAPAVVKRNMENNGIDSSLYDVRVCDITKEKETEVEEYDIIFANIVADVIKAIAAPSIKMLKKGGELIASGIIDTRKDEVRASIEQAGYEIEKEEEREGWVMIRAKKN